MTNLPLNFSAPTAQVQNTYAAPARTNPYLTPSQYEGMQLHTPSGLYYQGGNVYEPYTVGTKYVGGGMSPFSRYNSFGYGGIGQAVPDIKKGSIQIGNQYFKPFTGNAQGIINGNLSMVSMLNKQPTYQPQALSNLFPSLNSNLNSALPQQGMLSSPSYGAGRFTGLLNSPIVTTNTQGK
jgi:hypothetical protein